MSAAYPNRPVSRENPYGSINGYAMVLVALAFAALGLGTLVNAPHNSLWALAGPLLLVLAVLTGAGLYMVQPNEAALLLLFGAYQGSDRNSGLRWANPLFKKRRISLRARNFASDTLKVNDQRGNPIEVAAAIVWRVVDTAKASFDVEAYETYVRIQSETALRHMASSYAYDSSADDGHQTVTLRAGQDAVAATLARELQQRLEPCGVVVAEARLTHLAYSPEIAQVMLRRQQAEAIIDARTRIVEGAVSMVELALNRLSKSQLMHLDDERRASMVSNLMVVLCSDRETQPVVNTGTLYN